MYLNRGDFNGSSRFATLKIWGAVAADCLIFVIYCFHFVITVAAVSSNFVLNINEI